jgi:hypothetical protein
MAQGDAALTQGEAHRRRGGFWLSVGLDLGVIAGLIALMCGVPPLDPGRAEGRYFGTFLAFAWWLGLMVWALGIVRRQGSRFTVRTLVVLSAMVAAFLGLCRILPPTIPVMFGAAGFSAMMLYEAHRPGVDASIGTGPFRGRVGRAVMLVGGLLFVAHFARILGLTALVALGLLKPPA